MTREIQSTCCYCGVGCGVLIETEGDRLVGVRGDPSHPANGGRLCTKGSTTADMLRAPGRMDKASMRTDRAAELRNALG